MEVLDNAAWWALTGAHQLHLAEGRGGARRYRSDLAPFAAVPDDPTPGDWADLAGLTDAEGGVVLFRAPLALPPGWSERWGGDGVQLVWPGGDPGDDGAGDVVELGEGDAADALALATETRPGPFAARTVALGRYVGVRDPASGRLVAMAGERLHPEGACEVSAVCTLPGWRRRGLASRLVAAVVAGIVGRGEVALLHAASDNATAIRLYLDMGFTHRRDVRFSRIEHRSG